MPYRRRRGGRHVGYPYLPEESARRQVGRRRHARARPNGPPLMAMATALVLGAGFAGYYALHQDGEDLIKPTQLTPPQERGNRVPGGGGTVNRPPSRHNSRTPTPTDPTPTFTPTPKRAAPPTEEGVPDLIPEPDPTGADDPTPTPTCSESLHATPAAKPKPKPHGSPLGLGLNVRVGATVRPPLSP